MVGLSCIFPPCGFCGPLAAQISCAIRTKVGIRSSTADFRRVEAQTQLLLRILSSSSSSSSSSDSLSSNIRNWPTSIAIRIHSFISLGNSHPQGESLRRRRGRTNPTT